jgi:epoxyqueuosine reductase QueG
MDGMVAVRNNSTISYKPVIQKIETAIQETIEARGGAARWKNALIAVISARNPELAWLKTAVSPEHLLPDDVLPGAQSVICFFIPFARAVVESNRETGPASAEWAAAYIETNALIAGINSGIDALLKRRGYAAGKIPATGNFDKTTLTSRWSHRHLAYLAGLGSFGLNNMLITEYGCCGRCGSIVTNYQFTEETCAAPLPRRERCLFKQRGICGLCLKKCEICALGGSGFDRRRCYERCLENAVFHASLGYADVCGKCLCGLPCSMRDPSAVSSPSANIHGIKE